jgi:hypothetical protein
VGQWDQKNRIVYVFVSIVAILCQLNLLLAPTQLLPGQLSWEGEGGSSKTSAASSETKGEANEVTSEDVCSIGYFIYKYLTFQDANPNDETASSFMKSLGKAMSGDGSSVLNLKKKKTKPAQNNAGFVTRSTIYKEKTQTETNTFQTKQV